MPVLVTLLGRPSITVDGQRVEPVHDQRSALLYYLASSGGWVAREDLLALFWAERPEHKARAALRQLLIRTARQPFAVGMFVERSRVWWPVATDVAALSSPGDDLEAWPGVFMETFRVLDAPEYDDWLTLERSAWDERWRAWALRAADALVMEQRPERAADVLAAWLTRDPLDEVAFRAWCAASHRLGRRSSIAQRYARLVSTLARELGVEPDPATRAAAVVEQIGVETEPLHFDGSLTVRHETSVARHPTALARLSNASEALVGRDGELAEIATACASPGTTVIIVGAGGMGKTALATAAARRLGAERGDRSVVASVRGARDEHDIGRALHTALALPPRPGRRPLDQALESLAQRPVVVVLDEVDSLERPAEALQPLRTGAPAVAWLLTSRLRIDVPTASTIEIGGLPIPEQDRDVLTAPASVLFVRQVSRFGVHVDLERDADAVIAVCRCCGGMPLALELAAGWARVLPLVRIAEELRHGLAVLHDVEADPDAPHGSVRRVFEASWDALPDGAQTTLVQLSVLRDGFDDAAAREVASAGLPQLLALRNASFLNLDSDGRYSQHPLIAAFVRERAGDASEVRSAAAERHARCFLARLDTWEREGHGPEPAAVMAALQRDHANVEAAWHHAVAHGWWDALKAGGPTLGLSYALAGRAARWSELHRAALAVVPAESAAWAMLEVFDSAAATFEGRHEEAYERRTRAVAVLRREGSERDLAWGLFRHGMAAEAVGRLDEAFSSLESSAALYGGLDEPHYLGLALTSLHALSRSQVEGDKRFAVADAHLRVTGNHDLRADLLDQHASLTVALSGRFGDALAQADEALRLERAAAWSPLHEARRLHTCAWVRVGMGDAGGARSHALEAVRLFQPFESQFPTEAHDVRAVLAWASWLLDDGDGLAAYLDPGAPAASTLKGLALRVELALERGELATAASCAATALALTDAAPMRWQQRLRLGTALVLAARCSIAAHDSTEALENLGEALRVARVDPLVPLLLSACAAALPLLDDPDGRVARALRHQAALLPFAVRRALPRTVSGQRPGAARQEDDVTMDPDAIADAVARGLDASTAIVSGRKRSR